MIFSESYNLLFEAQPFKNKGFIAEALVSIAIFTKFVKKGEKVYYSDLEKYIKNLRTKYTVGSLKDKGITIHEDYAEVKDTLNKNIKDKIKLKIKISNRSLEYLMGHPGGKDFNPDGHKYSLDFGEEMYSAASFVNSHSVTPYVKKVVGNKEKNIVQITCDGLSNNNSIKTDVWLEVDGQKIPAFDFSIKSRNTEQLAQHSDANKKYVQIRFWNDLCGIDVGPYFNKSKIEEVEDVDDYFKFITNLIKNNLTSQKEDATFIARLGEGIKKSATLGKDLILLSIDGTTKGLFRTFNFRAIEDALVESNVDLSCKQSPDVNKDGAKTKQTWLKIYATDNDSPSGVLVKIRYRNDTTMTAITLEKGPLLERLTEMSADNY